MEDPALNVETPSLLPKDSKLTKLTPVKATQSTTLPPLAAYKADNAIDGARRCIYRENDIIRNSIAVTEH